MEINKNALRTAIAEALMDCLVKEESENLINGTDYSLSFSTINSDNFLLSRIVLKKGDGTYCDGYQIRDFADSFFSLFRENVFDDIVEEILSCII